MNSGDIFYVEAPTWAVRRRFINNCRACSQCGVNGDTLLTVAHQPEEQDRRGAGKVQAHVGHERFRVEFTALRVTWLSSSHFHCSDLKGKTVSRIL